MTRRSLLVATLFAAGCRKQSSDFPFPETVAAWTRSAPPISMPPLPAARKAWQATYAGPFAVTVTINEMSSGAVALDAIQRWRSAAGKMPFFRDKYLGVAEAPGRAANDLSAFVRAFEEASGK